MKPSLENRRLRTEPTARKNRDVWTTQERTRAPMRGPNPARGKREASAPRQTARRDSPNPSRGKCEASALRQAKACAGGGCEISDAAATRSCCRAPAGRVVPGRRFLTTGSFVPRGCSFTGRSRVPRFALGSSWSGRTCTLCCLGATFTSYALASPRAGLITLVKLRYLPRWLLLCRVVPAARVDHPLRAVGKASLPGGRVAGSASVAGICRL